MLLSVLWNQNIETLVIDAKKGRFFPIEQDSGFWVGCQQDTWVIQLSENLQFLDSGRRKRPIRQFHLELCYLSFYQKIDLYFVLEDKGYNQYQLIRRPRSKMTVGGAGCSVELKAAGDEVWAELDFRRGIGLQRAVLPGLYADGVHDPRPDLTSCRRLTLGPLQILIHQDFLAINNPGLMAKLNLTPDPPVLKPSFIAPDVLPLPQRIPFRYRIERPSLKLKLDLPPAAPSAPDRGPIWMSAGPTLMMGMASLALGLQMASRLGSESASMMIVMPAVMMVSAVLWPGLQKLRNNVHQRRIKTQRHRQLDFQFQQLGDSLEQFRKRVRDDLSQRCPDLEQLAQQSLLNRYIYDHPPDHPDFGLIVLGIGRGELPVTVELPDNCERLDAEERRRLTEWPGRHPYIDRIPLEWDLFRWKVTVLAADEKSSGAFLSRLTAQLALRHSPAAVRCLWLGKAVFVPEEIDWLPHFRDDAGLRLKGELPEAAANLLSRAAAILEKGLRLILFASGKAAAEADLWCREHSGSYCWQLAADRSEILYSAEIIIDIQQNHGKVLTPCQRILHEFDCSATLKWETRSKIIELCRSYQPSAERRRIGAILPEAGRSIEWDLHDAGEGLRIPLGWDEEGREIILDLHEKGQGPHGLIAGMTGSGKSELLLAMILSACWRYGPDQLQLAIIDYKGGSLIHQLHVNNNSLPHLCGALNNVDQGQIERSLIYLRQECLSRQREFARAQKLSCQPVADLDHYRRLCRQLPELKPLAHLILIVDEFAELRLAQPQFIADLVQMSRIGRSLGLHLILATQKPSGVVDEQMWSNFRFRICLKVAEKQDSLDMLHDPRASQLQKPGQFYLAWDQQIQAGRGVWTHKQFPPPLRIRLLDDMLQPRAERLIKAGEGPDQGQRMILAMAAECRRRRLTIPSLWPEPLKISDVRSLCKRMPVAEAALILGEGEDPEGGGRFILRHPLRHGVILIPSQKDKERFVQLITARAAWTCETELMMIDPLYHDGAGSAPSARLSMDIPELWERSWQWLTWHLDQRCLRPHLTLLLFHPGVIAEQSAQARDVLLRLIQEGEAQGILIILILDNLNALPMKYWQTISCRYTLGISDSAVISSFFECHMKRSALGSGGRGIVSRGGLLEFELAEAAEDDERLRCEYWQIPQMPKFDRSWLRRRDLYLGMDPVHCIPVWHCWEPGKVLVICSHDEELLRKKALQLRRRTAVNPIAVHARYEDTTMPDLNHSEAMHIILAAASSLSQDSLRPQLDFRSVLWLGSDPEQQYLFAVRPGLPVLDEQDMVYLHKGKQRLLKEVE